MTTRGRKPKPVALKLIQGNPGKRKLNTSEPKYERPSNLECPDWLGDYGREMWGRVAHLLHDQGVLRVTDIQVLEAYCDAYDQFRKAQIAVNDDGVLMEQDGRTVKNPAIAIVREASAAMMSFGATLGLDPMNRQRIVGSSPNHREGNPFSDLIT